MFDIQGFSIITYIVKMAGTTNVSQDIRGIQDISVRDTEVHLYFHQPIQTISKNTNLVSKSLQSIMQRCCVEIKIKNGDKCLK